MDVVPRGRARRSGERFMRCRNDINAVVFLCLAETDAVSAFVQHDIPARWSEQVPDSLLRALCEVSVLCWLCGQCWAGRVPASAGSTRVPVPGWPGIHRQDLPKFGSFYFLLLNLVFHGSFKK